MKVWASNEGKIILFLITLLCSGILNARAGGRESGGGDKYVLDFTLQATRAYEWLKNHGQKLTPPVDAGAFMAALNKALKEDKIQSTKDSKMWRGVPKDAIYTVSNDVTYLIQSRYSLDDPGPQIPAKIRLAAHEVFRRMGLEGDTYLLSRQIDVMSIYLSPQLQAQKLLAGRTIECAFTEKSFGIVSFDVNGNGSKNDFCFGGDETLSSVQGNMVVITCGDDGQQSLILMDSLDRLTDQKPRCVVKGRSIDWGDQTGSIFEAVTYMNISPGYPYKDGSSRYLTCCVR